MTTLLTTPGTMARPRDLSRFVGADESAPPSVLLSLLSGYWKLEEVSGTRYDSSANHLDLTSNNSVGQTSGIAGNAASFAAASSQYLSAASNSLLQWGEHDITLWFWCYLTATTASNSMALVSKGPTPLEMAIDYYKPAGTLRFVTFPTSSEVDSTAFSLGSWHFVVARQNINANTLSIQLDNGAVQTAARGGSTDAGAGAFDIGNWTQFSGEYWNGYIDEIGMIKSPPGGGGVMSTAQATALWNGGAGVTYPFPGVP